MRKHIQIMTVIVLLLCISLSSCKKSFLEIVPKGILVASTYNDYDLLMNSTLFYQYNTGGGWQAAMLMGDEVAAEESIYTTPYGSSPQARALFQWDDVVFQANDQIQNTFLSSFLQNVFTCNKIINEVTLVKDGTTQQKLELQAEAKATRAFIYFQLINYFGKPYNPSSAANDPGVPIMTTSDITIKNLNRSNVQAVYDFIIKDLTEATANIQDNPPVATRMSKAAVEGLLGKVYLFMGKYTEALTNINASFRDIATMSKPPKLYNYNTTFSAGGSFLPVDPYGGPASPFNNETDLTESVVATMFYGGQFAGNGYGNDFLTLTPEAQALYGTTDFRLNFYSPRQLSGQPYSQNRVRKYGVKYVRFGLELPDLYLLSAECKARTGDLSGAKNDVQTLRQNRISVADAVLPASAVTSQTNLIKFILDERIREFAATGYRWFDMRRLSVDPLFSSQPAAVHTLYLMAGGTTLFTLRPGRLTLRFPSAYVDQNPGMVNNP
jgi:hypothetical protein